MCFSPTFAKRYTLEQKLNGFKEHRICAKYHIVSCRGRKFSAALGFVKIKITDNITQ